ncbi:MAG: zf-HC2 domain-containing protein [Deltaproteobacteria bacterium]|nr:zf-HC2 domain-containing protein [Deltaproteobacteria bacterium]
MNCKRIAELLLDYHDGTLDADDVLVVETHMTACGPCRACAATYKATSKLCKKTLAAAVPQDCEDRLLSFLRAKITTKP